MYGIIQNVINRGGYDLSAMLTKIDTLWVQGSLSDLQREELLEAARAGANPAGSVELLAKLEELDRRVRALETAGGGGEEVAPYVAGNWYYAGDRCVFEGAVYTCVAPDGVVCVWSPADFPSYWQRG